MHNNKTILKGKKLSDGFALGEALILNQRLSLEHYLYTTYDEHYTINNFLKALENAEIQLKSLKKNIEEKLTESASIIFQGHLLILQDQVFKKKVIGLIEKNINPPIALITIVKEYLEAIGNSESYLIQEKKQDLEDVALHILENLVQKKRNFSINQNKIVIIKEIFPSDILKLASENIKGIIIVGGGATSHISILIQSLKLPAIITTDKNILFLKNQTPILIEANSSQIYIKPSKDIIKAVEKKTQRKESKSKNNEKIFETTETKNKENIDLMTSVNLISDFNLSVKLKASGIGLYRSEFAFIFRNSIPSEEEQYNIYKKFFGPMKNKPITIRTLDIGGDKFLPYYPIKENNPFLGFRSSRFTIKYQDIFIKQIRAILRAGVDYPLYIIFPLISSIEEFLACKAIITLCLSDLKKEKIKYNQSPKIGIMLEIPSVVHIMEELCQYVDFFSIGANDLIQYTLAVDRTNEKVADLYIPHHPAILRSLFHMVSIANKNNVEISICGNMTENTDYLSFLIGIGLRKLIVNPKKMINIQRAIKKISTKEAKQIAKKALNVSTLKKIEKILKIN